MSALSLSDFVDPEKEYQRVCALLNEVSQKHEHTSRKNATIRQQLAEVEKDNENVARRLRGAESDTVRYYKQTIEPAMQLALCKADAERIDWILNNPQSFEDIFEEVFYESGVAGANDEMKSVVLTRIDSTMGKEQP